ncbi:hypothetical protein ACFST9_13690 [Hymenobacter monticola]|uniref:Uncharacterized protein n=2 Tax=Hymenobacter TaxID=89966 RepID=A0ABY4BIT5_9BACT|nr:MULTISPECIES: hypothetical protein [Hymenobacter]MDU0372239.1 hypothetical protein [Hymenobacter endophyticus]UOE36520.1 hypothetical protein MTP16_24390 [Hymenobacter monticola]
MQQVGKTQQVSVSEPTWITTHWNDTISFFTENATDIKVNVLGAALGAFLGLVAAYYVYKLQVWASNRSEKEAARRKHQEHLSYFAGVLQDVLTYATAQADALDKFVSEIAAAPTTIQRLGLVVSGSVGRLNRADSEATFHAYNALFADNAEHEKNYKRMLSLTDSLTARVGAVRDSFERYRDSAYQRHLRFKEQVQKSSNDVAALLDEYDASRTERIIKRADPTAQIIAEAELGKLNDLLLDYGKLNARVVPLELYMEQYVRPLKEWLSENNRFLTPKGKNLRELLKDASVVFTDLKKDALDFQAAFASGDIRKTIKALSESRDALSSSVPEQPSLHKE